MAHEGTLLSLASKVSRRTIILAAVIAAAATLACVGIGKYPFWDDEAETALIARNIVEHGSMSAWTGSNIAAFRGGIDLNDSLIQSKLPLLQYFVVAASFWQFGVGTVTGRLPFLIAGLVTLWLVHHWTRTYLGPNFPSWLPSLMLALNVPFLLYIAQCRYYALVMMFSAALLWSWAEALQGRRPITACLAGAGAIFGLCESNYMDAAAMAIACAAGCFWPPVRCRRSIIYLLVIYLSLALGLVLLFVSWGGLEPWRILRSSTPFTAHFAILIGWQIKGLGSFEFVPIWPMPLLILPWVLERLRPARPVATRALIAGFMGLAILVMIAALSPQDLATTEVADMRYDIPLFVVGSLITATAIVIVAKAGWNTAAVVMACGILFTNAFYAGIGRLQCTLCERLDELGEAHPSGTAAMLFAASLLPAGTSLAVRPSYMTMPLMFYRPDLRYTGVLDPNKQITPAIRAKLPTWVFCCSEAPDVLLVGIGGVRSVEELPTAGHKYLEEKLINLTWFDQTRPELPWHAFRPDRLRDQANGIAVLRRTD